MALHTDSEIRLSACRNQIRDVLLRGGESTASPLEIANIFELNMLDKNASPIDIVSSVDEIVVRSVREECSRRNILNYPLRINKQMIDIFQ